MLYHKKYNVAAIVGCTITAAVIILSIFGPLLWHANPNIKVLEQRLMPPLSKGHPLGTDQLGRDILSRIFYGGRTSLVISILSVIASTFLGTFLGLISGYYGGWIDSIVSRLVEFQMAFPTIVLALIIASLFKPGIFNLIIILIITGWVTHSRMVRGAVISINNEEYIQVSKAIGCSDFRIIVFHIIPNILPLICIMSTLEIGRRIILESTLSFLGVGLQPPSVSWGQMLNEGQEYITKAWWLAFFPGLAPALTVLGINLFGDWIREKLDPKTT